MSDHLADTQARFPSLAGRVVIITGGASGIGAALCEAFAQQDSVVATIDVLQGRGLAPVHEYRCDLADLSALQQTLETIVADLGQPAVLINNAGNDDRHELSRASPDDWDRIMATNLRHMFFASQYVAGRMKSNGTGGAIINLGSIAWMIPEPGMPIYLIAKSAVHGLTRALAVEFGGAAIRANTLAPGWVMTERQRRLWLTPEAEAHLDRVQLLPGRIEPADVAGLALFLAASEGRMITGQQFILDGGRV